MKMVEKTSWNGNKVMFKFGHSTEIYKQKNLPSYLAVFSVKILFFWNYLEGNFSNYFDFILYYESLLFFLQIKSLEIVISQLDKLQESYYNFIHQKGTGKEPWGLRVKLPPARLFTARSGGFILSLLLLNVKLGSCEYQIFVVFGFTRPEIGPESESTVMVADVLFIRLRIC